MRTPIMIAVAALSAAALAACADTRAVPYEKLAQENEVNGFRVAVVDVCLQSAIAGTPVSAMSGEEGSIIPASAALTRDNDGKAGTLWSPRSARNVLIRVDGRTCEVTTQGAQTKAAQASLEEALSDPHGFVVDKAEAVGKPTDKRFSKKLGTQTYRVTLAGAGMGGDAPSSKLTATVTSTPA
jgi:hypothetical protein